MAKTTNINLNLTEDENTSFVDWRKSIDGNNDSQNKSNMQIIDEKIGDHETRITTLENAGGGSGGGGDGLKWKKLNSLAELKSNLNANNLGKLVKIASKANTSLSIPGSLSFCVPVSYDGLNLEGLGYVYYINHTKFSSYGTYLYFVRLIIPNTSSPIFTYHSIKPSDDGTFTIESKEMYLLEDTIDIYIEE